MMIPEQKRRKVDDAPSRRNAPSPTATSMNRSMQNVAQTSSNHLRIQHAQNHAVAQAQQEGCMGNFKIFDSPFGNFLVPVIPTPAELG